MLNENTQKSLIAKCIIKALYDFNTDVCTTKILNIIMDPLLVKNINSQSEGNCIKSEKEVSQCIESLSKLFITTHAEFTCLPTKILMRIALPLFYLNLQSKGSVYAHQGQVRQLILKILEDESTRYSIFSAFLNHTTFKNDEFGEKISFRFGTNGGLEVVSNLPTVDYDLIATSLVNLTENDGQVSFQLFTYLLKVLPELNDEALKVDTGVLLETTTDTLERIEKQITAVKLLTLLSDLKTVQVSLMKNPEPVLELIKFFFSKIISHSAEKDDETYFQDTEILYASLLLIKHIITANQKGVTVSWKTFEEFINFIKQQFFTQNIPKNVVAIVEEIDTTIKKKGKATKSYYDASADKNDLSDFQKALADLADPLIPVRAHGIIELTKLIENRHPETEEYKNLLFSIFQVIWAINTRTPLVLL